MTKKISPPFRIAQPVSVGLVLLSLALCVSTTTGFALPISHHHLHQKSAVTTSSPKSITRSSSSTRLSATFAETPTAVGPRMSINEEFPGLEKIYSNPDIFVIEDFLTPDACQDIITRASEKTLQQSPVAYAGWTQDFQDLVELAVKGPVVWAALISAWLQLKDTADANNTFALVSIALKNFGIFLGIAVAGIAAYTKSRADGLQHLRTSTSTTLDDLSNSKSGTTQFVQQTAKLFAGDDKRMMREEADLFEAPTVIRYEADQVLAPHFDANRSAETEDANRGGQTLATLLVYLNDVDNGGLTRFGRLLPNEFSKKCGEKNLVVQPKLGDALLFFPADAAGNFDERTEHEGCPAVDEKWIARIWRHASRVPPPFGLNDSALKKV